MCQIDLFIFIVRYAIKLFWAFPLRGQALPGLTAGRSLRDWPLATLLVLNAKCDLTLRLCSVQRPNPSGPSTTSPSTGTPLHRRVVRSERDFNQMLLSTIPLYKGNEPKAQGDQTPKIGGWGLNYDKRYLPSWGVGGC
jgi:hypothetical protein